MKSHFRVRLLGLVAVAVRDVQNIGDLFAHGFRFATQTIEAHFLCDAARSE